MGRRNEYADVFRYIDMRPEPPLTCWLWTASVSDKGIPYFRVDGKNWVAYRLVYWLTHPEWDILNRREFILHTCMDMNGKPVDDPRCCNPDHLRPGTHMENMLDMMLRGRKGLTRPALADILDLHLKQPDLTHSQIASIVSHRHDQNVARQTVTDILSRRRRRALSDAIDLLNKQIEESGGKT
jgi:hypothetical protein